MQIMSKFYLRAVTVLFISIFFLNSCNIYKYTPAKDNPVKGIDRAKKNVKEGRGISAGNILKRGGTNYEFSTSNSMWRASLEILDFLPMTTVDYSGGMIISDWYSDSPNDEAIKITIRFLSNEIRSDSLKIIVHKKKCENNLSNCKINILENSKIANELRQTIIRKASLLDKERKKKK